MNLIPADEYYNRCPVRVRQGQHRAAKTGYRALGVRAAHDVQRNPKDNKRG